MAEGKDENPGERGDGLQLEQDPRREILTKLEAAANAEARVQVFAKLVDTYGLDALIGLLLPVVGDGAITILAGSYLLFEGHKAGIIEKSTVRRIIKLQLIDFIVGLTPLIGDALDHWLVRANTRSTDMFQDHTQELLGQARRAEISEAEIAEALRGSEKIRQSGSILHLLGRMIRVRGKVTHLLKGREKEGK